MLLTNRIGKSIVMIVIVPEKEKLEVALSPEDLALTHEEEDEVLKFEALIDAELSQKPLVKGRVDITVRYTEPVPDRIRAGIIKKYESVGWKKVTMTLGLCCQLWAFSTIEI